jgi:hypothetical protein
MANAGVFRWRSTGLWWLLTSYRLLLFFNDPRMRTGPNTNGTFTLVGLPHNLLLNCHGIRVLIPTFALHHHFHHITLLAMQDPSSSSR